MVSKKTTPEFNNSEQEPNDKVKSVKNIITEEKLKKYFEVTGKALEIVKTSEMDKNNIEKALDFLDMASRYYSDAHYFYSKGDWINAFAALNYAHGWLDSGARIQLFKVHDSKLFTVDEIEDKNE